MTQAVALSVVIPCLNGSRYLDELLKSLAGQRPGCPWEVVVADNGSTDTSLSICAEFAGQLPLVTVDASDRRGQAHARNVGARTARGRKLLFLDQDDCPADDYVAAMSDALDSHPFVAGAMDFVRLNTDWAVRARASAIGQGLRPGVYPWAYGCVLGIERAYFESVGGFDEDLPCAEDMDLCWRVSRTTGVSVQLVPDAVLHYRLKTSYGALFRQGLLYGQGGAALYRRWRFHGMERRGTTQVLRSWGAVIGRLVTSRETGARGEAYFLAGQRLGCLLGSVREHIVFL
jgi:glycosyltransferase involved in cell wall biosynthesis